MTEKKLDLKETKEVHAFIISVVADAKKHKEDGKITSMEWMQNAMKNAPAGVRAMMGISEVDDELKELDEKEVMELAGMGVQLLKAFADLFAGKE